MRNERREKQRFLHHFAGGKRWEKSSFLLKTCNISFMFLCKMRYSCISKFSYPTFIFSMVQGVLIVVLMTLETKMWYGKTRVTSYEIRVASYELLVTSWKLKSTSWNSKVQVQIHELPVQICEFKFTTHEFNFISYEFKSTSYVFKRTSYEFKSTSSRIN